MYDKLPSNCRILHCPENIGNNPKSLSDYEKTKGIHSWSISLRRDPFGFKPDQTLVNSGSFVLGEIARWHLLFIALRKYNVIHFNNGKTIMPHRVPFESIRQRTNFVIAALYQPYAWVLEGFDLSIFKLFGKQIYFTFQGSDARLSTHYTRLHQPETLAGLHSDYLSKNADALKKTRIKRAEKYATQIFCLNPDLLINFSDKAKFQPYYNVDIDNISPHQVFVGKKIHIVHAPSKRDIKGSKFIVDAVNEICSVYPEVKFTLVENLTNLEAQKIYDTADLFIDQLIVGWYGGVALELMARGTPTLCFLDKDSLNALPTDLRLNIPITNVNIENLYETLNTILRKPKLEMKERGKQCRRFAEEFHAIQNMN